MIKVLLFDFYGVFLPDAYNTWLKTNNKTREGIFAEVINKRDKGLIDEAGFFAEVSTAIGRTVTITEIHPQDRTVDAELVEFITGLKAQYKVCLFSNASLALRQKLKTLAIDTLFDEVILSGEIGYAKPSNEAFAVAIKRTNVNPNEIFFIDDTLANIEAALKHNLQAHHYTTVDDLREAVSRLAPA